MAGRDRDAATVVYCKVVFRGYLAAPSLHAGPANGLEVGDAETRLAEADILIAAAEFRAARAQDILARTTAEDWNGSEAGLP